MALGITCDSPPDGDVGIAYSHFFPVTGDTPPDVWSITAGALPDGLTLNAATGEVSGIPTVQNDFSFTIQVADSTLATATAECGIDINAALGISCDSPPEGEIGIAYSHFFPASGGAFPYSFAITAGALPDGLTLDTGTGEVSGVPTVANTFGFTVQITDGLDVTANVECSIIIAAAVGITCDSPLEGTVGTAYSHFFPATGGVEPYVFAISAGALPDGLTLDAGTGEVSGTPTVADTFGFTVQVTDALDATDNVECAIDIVTAPPSVTCDNPPPGEVGLAYSHFFPASGGVEPYTWAVSAGALPDGLNLDAGTGEVSGTPTLAGFFEFTIQVTDADDVTASVGCFIQIFDAVSISCDDPPAAMIQRPYSHIFPFAGGVAPYTADISAGTIPTGLTFDGAGTAFIFGVPLLPKGLFTFTVHVVDGLGGEASVECSIQVNCPTNSQGV